MHRTTTAVLATLLALGTLAACGSQDPPTPADPSTTITSPSTTPGPVVPTMPAAAFRHDKAGAIAFTKYYWAMVDYAQASGDTSQLAPVAASSCAACKGGVSSIDAISSAGGASRGGLHLIRKTWVPVPPDSSRADCVVVLRMYVTRQTVTHAGKDSGRYPPGTDVVTMTLRRTPRSWQILSWHL